MNPMENVIGAVKDAYLMRSQVRDNTKERVITLHQQAWDDFDMDQLREWVKDMPHRMLELYRAEGGYTATRW